MSFVRISMFVVVAIAFEAGTAAVSLPSLSSSSNILQQIQSVIANAKLPTTKATPITTKATTNAVQWTSQCEKEITNLYNALVQQKNKALAQDVVKYFQQLVQYKLGSTSVLPAYPTDVVPAYIDANCAQAGINMVTGQQIQTYLPTLQKFAGLF